MNERNERCLKTRFSHWHIPSFSRAVLIGALMLSAGAAPDANASDKQVGKASWYGPGFHGKKTASGEPFDQHRLTAAHPRLPLGSQARVTNLNNGKVVVVTINDRGPHGGGRIIDLSRAAARMLAMNGTARVSIEALP